MKFYKDRVCLNVLAGSIENAIEIDKVAQGYAVVGVLSSNYQTVQDAVKDMSRYSQVLNGRLSIGLGGGNPNQWKMVGDLAEKVQADHVNQVFTGVGYTRAKAQGEGKLINALVSPTGKVGFVKVSTGPVSSLVKEEAVIPVEAAIAMVKDMGGNSLKFFPMNGLKTKEELRAVAAACASEDFILEPTGGIDLNNFEEILTIILNEGVKKVIPHIYTSIIDSNTGDTKIKDVQTLMELTEKVITDTSTLY